MKILSNLGFEKSNFSNLSLWTLITDKEEIKQNLEKITRNSKISLSLSRLPVIIGKQAEKYVLSLREPAEREIILTYKKFLLEYVMHFKGPINEEIESIQHLFLELSRSKLNKLFPDCIISDKMVEIESMREYQKHIKLIQTLDRTILQPRNLEDISRIIQTLQKIREFKGEQTETEKQHLKEISSYLQNKRNKKLFDNFMLDLNERAPKILLMYASGFTEYSAKIEKIRLMEQRTNELLNSGKIGYYKIN